MSPKTVHTGCTRESACFVDIHMAPARAAQWTCTRRSFGSYGRSLRHCPLGTRRRPPLAPYPARGSGTLYHWHAWHRFEVLELGFWLSCVNCLRVSPTLWRRVLYRTLVLTCFGATRSALTVRVWGPLRLLTTTVLIRSSRHFMEAFALVPIVHVRKCARYPEASRFWRTQRVQRGRELRTRKQSLFPSSSGFYVKSVIWDDGTSRRLSTAEIGRTDCNLHRNRFALTKFEQLRITA